MPQKLLIQAADVIVTALSLLALATWSTLINCLPAILATIYWVPKIKYSVINRHYGGSWLNWLKSFFKKE